MARKISILLPPLGLYPGLGSMLADAFRELGWQPTVGYRGDAAALQAEVLLLAGMCRHIDGAHEMLRQRHRKVPVTLHWQLEPLPPEQLSRRGEEVGARLAAGDWARLPPVRRRLLEALIPFRTRLLRAWHRWRARPYTTEVLRSADRQGWLEYDAEIYFSATAEWEWIKVAHANGWLDYCFASVQPRVRFLRSRGVPAEMIPFGYHPDWGRDHGRTRDIDVLFLGRLGHGPREAKVRQVQAGLDRLGRSLTFVPRAFGAAREEWLNRTKIMLNLLRVPHDLAGMRVMIGLAGGACVVSEACADPGAFVSGKHFVCAPMAELPTVIEYYLTHEHERRVIAMEGHRFVTEELTLPKVLRRMLGLAGIREQP